MKSFVDLLLILVRQTGAKGLEYTVVAIGIPRQAPPLPRVRGEKKNLPVRKETLENLSLAYSVIMERGNRTRGEGESSR